VSETKSQIAALYDDCGMAAFSLCLAIIGDEDAAAEIVGDACRATPPGSPTDRAAWLLAETHRRAVLAVRRVSAKNPTDAIDAQQLLRFATLSGEQRLALGLAYYGGLTVGTVAERLAVSRGHVLGLLSSALSQIENLAAGGATAKAALASPRHDLAGPAAQRTDAAGAEAAACGEHEQEHHRRKQQPHSA
jgi:DNA-directed RNA polymerase specialized sigma24 family protein